MGYTNYTCRWCYTSLQQKHHTCPICRRSLQSKNLRKKKTKKLRKNNIANPNIKTTRIKDWARSIKEECPYLKLDPCSYCNNHILGSMTVDHIQPLSKGGKNHYTNATMACSQCNTNKADNKLILYLAER